MSRRHKVHAVVCWRFDRSAGTSDILWDYRTSQAGGVAFVRLGEGIDASTAAGRLVAGVLGSIAEFERARVQERIHAGLMRAKEQTRHLGRPGRVRGALSRGRGGAARPEPDAS